MLRVKTKRRNVALWGLGATLTAAAIFGVVIYKSPSDITRAANESISTGSAITGRVNQQIPITSVSISGTGNDSVPVKLQVNSGSLYMTTTTGLTFTTPVTGSSIAFSGARNDVNAALATLHYAGTGVGSDTLTVSLADQNTIYNPTTGHVYQYIPGSITWWDARDAAAASTYQGVSGYLATITSQGENDFIKDRLNGNAWLGGSDDATYGGEGHWEWVTGPEAGTHIYDGTGSSGSVVGGQYNNWATLEPNNSGGNENCMETYISDGTWNDLPCDATVDGYVVEYGGNGTNPGAIPNANVSITTTAATFAGGNGTPQSPYQITDCERLQDLNQDLSASYVLTHNIDCTDTPNWNGGQGFVPIGTGTGGVNAFTGTISGAGFAIDGLTEIRADDDSNTTDYTDPATNQDYVGLIGYGDGLTIDGLHLTNTKIKGYQYVGGLVGFMNNGTITNSSVNQGLDESSDTSCTPGYCIWARYGYYGGGLVGWMQGGTITGSKVGGLVKGSGNIIGGLVAHMEGGSSISDSDSTAALDGGTNIGGAVGEAFDSTVLTRVYATGNVIAKVNDEVGKVGYYAGGLVGYASNITIDQSYATGNVHADAYYAGGLVGQMSGVTITDSYATGAVSATDGYAGGLVGATNYSTISRAYASGSVDAPVYVGGLIGTVSLDSVSDSFAAGQVANQSNTGGLIGEQNGMTLHHDYFDLSTTGQANCTDDGILLNQCNPVNSAGSQPNYLLDYTNEPFTQSNSRVWTDGTWYFDGSHYPVLRMGTNNTASSRPFIDDNDGVTAAVEAAAPNNGDGNNDGTPDSEQANVVSFVNPVTNHYVTIEANSACSVTTATSAASQHHDDSYTYPFGLLNYSLDCGTPGFSTTVKLYYYNLSNANGMVVRKYDAATNSYSTISSAVVSGSNPVVVTYTLTDGGPLDEDGVANGVIVDPVGLAAAVSLSPVTSVIPGVPNTGEKSQSLVLFIGAAIAGLAVLGATIVGVRRYVSKARA